jgi:oxygen-independent coproporphyrinogen-3 oxidase
MPLRGMPRLRRPPTNHVALYVHIPFCQRKCAYCSFNSYAGLNHLFQAYVDALETEIARSGDGREPKQAPSLYLGGGTPTVLGLELLAHVLKACTDHYALSDGAEITIEANPASAGAALLRGLRLSGVNRLSLGVQSFDEAKLALLGRLHTARQVRATYRLARKAGFGNVNLDLIYGLPTQDLAQWEADLASAIGLGPEHISLYCLSVEEDTPLAARISDGELPTPDPDLAADMYEIGEAKLARAGYVHYEISNWAVPGHECRHNLVYWRNEPYLGFGAGAHSFDGVFRYHNVLSPQEYVERIASGREAVAGREQINRATEMSETVILGLRLREGVSLSDFQARFHVALEEAFSSQMRELTELGLVEVDRGALRLTNRGRLLGNEAFERFLPPRAS